MENFNFEPFWYEFGLTSNPYFTEPLLITTEKEGEKLEKLFVGRDKEKKEIKDLIRLGGGTRFLVYGEAGVGKTSLVNYMRSKLRDSIFFTPSTEIKILSNWTINDIILVTISELYSEIKKLKYEIKDNELKSQLEEVFQLSELLQDNENTFNINTQKLTKIFNNLILEIINIGFKNIVIHYNNLDNIQNLEKLLDLLNDMREFLQNNNVIYIFLGDETVKDIIEFRQRLREVFVLSHVHVGALSKEEISELINLRLEYLKIKDIAYHFIQPHSSECINVLYDLYEGNLRGILNSLTYSIKLTNKPKTISPLELKEFLVQTAQKRFLRNVSPLEKEILYKLIEMRRFTNSEIASLFTKKRQNITLYFKKFLEIRAIEEDEREGRNVFYKPTLEAKWLKLKVTELEIRKEKEKEENKKRKIDKKIKDINNMKLDKFFN